MGRAGVTEIDPSRRNHCYFFLRKNLFFTLMLEHRRPDTRRGEIDSFFPKDLSRLAIKGQNVTEALGFTHTHTHTNNGVVPPLG